MQKIIYYTLLCPFIAFCVAVGAFLIMHNCASSTFYECNLFNILQLATAVFLAIFVAHYMKNKYSDRHVQKRLFLEITQDISKLLENETAYLLRFMENSNRSKDERSKVFLILKKLGNKITILEQHKKDLNETILQLVSDLREVYNQTKELITDDYNFFEVKSCYSKDTINKVLKSTYDLTFVLDKIKMNMFK